MTLINRRNLEHTLLSIFGCICLCTDKKGSSKSYTVALHIFFLSCSTVLFFPVIAWAISTWKYWLFLLPSLIYIEPIEKMVLYIEQVWQFSTQKALQSIGNNVVYWHFKWHSIHTTICIFKTMRARSFLMKVVWWA